MKKYLAEALGSFTLAFVVALSLAGAFTLSTPVLAALVLGLFVYSIGGLSGAHLNPAITIGIWSLKKIPAHDAVLYLIAQLVGGGLALLVVTSILGTEMASAAAVVSNSLKVGIAEAVGAFFFAFGVAAVVYGKVSNGVTGLVVGGSLLLGIAVSVLLGASGVLNPAVALGIGSFNLMYVLGPIVGAALGMQAYRQLGR